MKLLLSQKNQLFDLIENFDTLSPSQFIFSETNDSSQNSVSVKMKNTEFYFLIIGDEQYLHTMYANYIPGNNVYKYISSGSNWNEIVHYFFEWLHNITREIAEPDRWERFKNEIGEANFSYNSDNSKFSVREFEDLKSRIDLINESVKSIPIILEHQMIIIQELERITFLAKDLGKFDWKNLLIGSIVNLIFQFGITKENAALIYDLIRNTLKAHFLS